MTTDRRRRRATMRRGARYLAVGVASALVLAACGTDDAEPPVTAPDDDGLEEEEVDLDLTFLSTQLRPVEEAEAVRNVILADFPGNVEFIGEDEGPFIDRIRAEAEADAGSIDLLGGLHGDFAALVDDDVLTDLTDVLDELDLDLPDSLLELARLGGDEVLYIPWIQATYVMVANNEALDHLPDGADLNDLTYDDVHAWAQALAEATGTPQFGLPAGEDGLLHRFFQGFLYPSFTGGVNTQFASDAAVSGWQWLADIWEFTNPQSTTYGFMQEPLLGGEVLLGWDHTARVVGALEERPDDFVAFPSPRGPEGLGFMPVVGGLAIPANAPDPDGARELIEYLTRPEIAGLTLQEVAFFPATGGDLPADLPPGVTALATAVQAQQESSAALPSLLPVGLGESGGEYNKVFQDSFRRIILQGEDAASVLDSEAPNLQSVFDSTGAPCWFPDPETDEPCTVG